MQMDSKRECESNRGGERERGVSDIVAFTLTFAIIITGVGLVSTVALEPITDFSDRQDVVNSERAFQAAATTIEELSRGGGVYEQFDVVPGDGNLYLARQQPASTGGPLLGNEGGLVASTTNSTLSDKFESLNNSMANGFYFAPTAAPPTTPDVLAFDTNVIVNRFGEDSYVGYQAGAVFRSDAAGLSYEPPFEFRPTGSGRVDAYISIVNLVPRENIQTASGFNSDVAIGPTQVPSGTPVTASNQFASFEVNRTNVAQISETIGSTDIFRLAALDGRGIGTENWFQYFSEVAEDTSGISANKPAPVSAVLTCDCREVTIRVVDVGISQLE
jgi:hypothetical protein